MEVSRERAAWPGGPVAIPLPAVTADMVATRREERAPVAVAAAAHLMEMADKGGTAGAARPEKVVTPTMQVVEAVPRALAAAPAAVGGIPTRVAPVGRAVRSPTAVAVATPSLAAGAGVGVALPTVTTGTTAAAVETVEGRAVAREVVAVAMLVEECPETQVVVAAAGPEEARAAAAEAPV
jgi:hypothetical protein